MSAHTPGLLFMAETFMEEGGRPEIVIRGIGGRAAVAVVMDFGNAPGMQEANAQRLTTCWNACLGLPQETLASGWTAAGMSTYAKGLEDKLRAARALLAEVVKPHDDHVKALQAGGEQPAINPLANRINNFLGGGAA